METPAFDILREVLTHFAYAKLASLVSLDTALLPYRTKRTHELRSYSPACAGLTLPRSIPSLFTVKDLCNLLSNFRARRSCLIPSLVNPCQYAIETTPRLLSRTIHRKVPHRRKGDKSRAPRALASLAKDRAPPEYLPLFDYVRALLLGRPALGAR
jgi:hypothetical protein